MKKIINKIIYILVIPIAFVIAVFDVISEELKYGRNV